MAIFIERHREVRFLTFLPAAILGILSAFFWPSISSIIFNAVDWAPSPFKFQFNWILPALLIASLLIIRMFSLQIFSNNRLSALRGYLFLVLVHFSIFSCFFSLTFLQSNQSNALRLIENEAIHFKGEIIKVEKWNKFNQKIIVLLSDVSNSSDTAMLKESLSPYKDQKILIRIKSALKDAYNIGDIIYGTGTLKIISKNKNPYAFNAQWYYKTQGILFQLSIDHDKVLLNSSNKINLSAKSSQLQKIFANKIEDKIQNKNASALLQALLLGKKDALTPETKNVFRKTGASHILAVSGLHLGIVFYLLFCVIGTIKHSSPIERSVKLIIYLFLLWSFAFITGLSPSVCRAATMISIVLVGQAISRRSSIWNAVGLSAFLLLLYQPLYILQVGFQLSYAALSGIILFGTKFQKIIYLRNRILKYCWGIVCVSICAQIFVLPISVYYFNQIPAMSIFSSLIGIPIAALLIGLGIAFLILGSIPLVGDLLSSSISTLVKYLLEALQYLSVFQPSHLSDLSLSGSDLILMMLCIMLAIFYLQYKKLFFLLSSFLLYTISALSLNFSFQQKAHEDSIHIYHKYDQPLMELMFGQKSYLLKSAYDSSEVQYINRPNQIHRGIQITEEILLSDSLYSDKYLDKIKAHIFMDDLQIVIVEKSAFIHSELFELSDRVIIWIISLNKQSKSVLQNISADDFSNYKYQFIMDNTLPPWDREKVTELIPEANLFDISKQGAFNKKIN